MNGLGCPHHSATGFSQRLFSPSLAFMVVLVLCVFVVVCDGFQRGFVVVVLLVFCGGSWRHSWWFVVGFYMAGWFVVVDQDLDSDLAVAITCGEVNSYNFD